MTEFERRTFISKLAISWVIVLVAFTGCPGKKQVADKRYEIQVDNPAFQRGPGPIVLIDEAHNNYHTAGGRYYKFAELLRLDGYVVMPLKPDFTRDSLDSCDILVISNALHDQNVGHWRLPTPSAFTDSEIDVVTHWVENGGALLLIADHMPFPGAAQKLAAEFGIRFTNSFAWDENRNPQITFRRTDETLRNHPITNGRNPGERIDSVVTFTGQAFTANTELDSLFVFDESIYADFPEQAWQFETDKPDSSVDGWLQGAVLKFGKGRVAVFGEAAMFTTQKAAGTHSQMGFNAPNAKQNARFILNLMHWLSSL